MYTEFEHNAMHQERLSDFATDRYHRSPNDGSIFGRRLRMRLVEIVAKILERIGTAAIESADAIRGTRSVRLQ